jgi:hypothetical protein
MEFLFRVSDRVSRCTSLGLPTYLAVEFCQEVDKWVENCGPAWTVVRLKGLKLDLLRQKAQLPPLTWVRKNRKGQWFGVIGALFRYADRSARCYLTVINTLMVYSGFEPKKPTNEHIRSFLSGVQAPDSFIPEDFFRHIEKVAIEQCGIQEHAVPERLVTFQGCPSTNAPIYQERSVSQDSHLEKELLWITEGGKFAHVAGNHSIFLNRHYRCYGPVLDGLDVFLAQNRIGLPGLSGGSFTRDGGPFETIYSKMRVSQPSPVWGGKVIPLMKDGGWKVRWIASPCRLHQLALQPLGLSLYKLLHTLPWDCTHQQEKGIPNIQNHLRKGETAFAVDLSSATDYFPLSIQLRILRALYPDSPYVELFSELSRASWSSPYLKGTISWTRGQPMGLYPSFASFGLSHGLLLASLAGVYRNQFYVLGDDVVILDRRLYDRYLQVLDMIGCPHDPHKSFVSNTVTEFAGKVITADNVFPQYKWRKVTDDNFLDLMKTFGQRFTPNLSPRQRKAYKGIAPLLLPVGCEHSHGDSRPFLQIWKETEDFMERVMVERKGRKFYISFLRRLLDTLQPSSNENSLYHQLDTYQMRILAQTHDQRVLSAFQQLPMQFPAIHSDVTDLFEFTGVHPDLDAVGPTSFASRRTFLSLLEEQLRIFDLQT